MSERERSICTHCGLTIEQDTTGVWVSNPDKFHWYEKLAEDPDLKDEPWFGACPGSRDILRLHPTFGHWIRALDKVEKYKGKSPDRPFSTHAPAPKLIIAAQEAINDV